jgi:hypothetical protein
VSSQLQPGLFDRPQTVSNPSKFLSAQERFEDFHRRNPQIYRLICEYARRLKSAGRTRYSIKTIWAVLRWQSDVQTEGEHFKLDDRHYSRYARMVMAREPDLEGFFNTRELRTR